MEKKTGLNELLLIFGTILWGGAFIFQSIGGKYIDPYTFNLLRNIVAFLFLLALCIISNLIKKKKDIKIKDNNKKELWLSGIFAGVALAFAQIFQQIGINNEGAGKSGFLTALYIIFVPLIGLIFKRKVSLFLWIGLALSLLGLYFININDGEFSMSFGTIMLILCALMYSIQIMIIDKYSKAHDAFSFSCIEFLFASIVLVPFSFIFKDYSLSLVKDALPSILYLGIASSGIAYTIQYYTQRNINVVIEKVDKNGTNKMCKDDYNLALDPFAYIGKHKKNSKSYDKYFKKN